MIELFLQLQDPNDLIQITFSSQEQFLWQKIISKHILKRQILGKF